MTLYDEIYAEVRKTLCVLDADVLASNLSTMSADEVRRLFRVVDEYEPSESEQGLIPIPDGGSRESIRRSLGSTAPIW